MTVLNVDTPHGPARAHLREPREPRGALVLGHGAGGGIGARDLQLVAEAAVTSGVAVALVEQPYIVAGRRSPAPARQLDAAWTAVVEHLRQAELGGLPPIVGGRSAGARVACRTAAESGAIAVLCLAFPVHAPGKGGDPAKSRVHELDAVDLPMLVVQGDKDPFGMPPAGRGRRVAVVPGNHSLKGDLDAVAEIVVGWLAEILGP